MEIKQAIEYCKKFINDFKNGDTNGVWGFNIQAIETVIEEYNNLKSRIDVLKTDIEEKSFQINCLSVSKSKIEKLIDDLYADDNTTYGTIRIIEMLKELMEDKNNDNN